MSLTLNTNSVNSQNSGSSVAELCDRNLATTAAVYAIAATAGATVAVGFAVIPEVAIIGCATGGILGTIGHNQNVASNKQKLTDLREKNVTATKAEHSSEESTESSKDEVVS